jgi:hypothetical protein
MHAAVIRLHSMQVRFPPACTQQYCTRLQGSSPQHVSYCHANHVQQRRGGLLPAALYTGVAMKAFAYMLCYVLLHSVAFAQWNMNPKINMQVVAHNQKFNLLGGIYHPNNPIHRLNSGQFLIDWSVGVYPGGYGLIATPVFAQLLNPDGRKAWPGWGVALVDSSFSNALHSYSVLVTTEDCIMVFYHRNPYRSDTNSIYSQLYLQKYDSRGQAIYPNGGILISSGVYWYITSDRKRPISAQTSDNAFMVAYPEYAYMQGGYNFRIRIQRVDSIGQAHYGPEGIAVTPWLRQWGGAGVGAEALFSDGRGGVHLFYTAFDNYRSHIYMQQVDSNGVTRWPDKGMKINVNAYMTTWAKIISTTDGCYIMTATQRDSSSTSGPNYHYAHKIDTAGNRIWNAEGVRLFPMHNYSQHSGRYNAASDGGSGMYWAGIRTDSLSGRFYKSFIVQRIDGSGRLCFGPEGKAIDSGVDASEIGSLPVLIPDGVGGAILSYEYLAPAGRSDLDEDIKGQRIDSTGRKLWGDSGVYISSADSSQQTPALIPDGQGGAVVVWTDYRNVTFGGLPPVRRSEIYATRIGPNGNAYPVELASFTARLEGEQVRLDWRTESETNNAGFEIERAIPPLGAAGGAYEAANWQRIGYVPGNGSTNVSSTYIYNDALTPELLGQTELLYRLRQIDYDGTYEYSPVARVLVNPPTAVSLEPVYPNPAQASAVLRIALPSEQAVRLALYDVLGREVLLVHDGSLPTGVHEYKAQLDRLPSGLYHVLLSTSEGRQARRMVVTRG